MIHNGKQSDHTSNDKVKLFHESIVVIKEEWFDDMNLTVDATFPMALIKRTKTGFNKRIKFPLDTKRRIW